MNLSLKNCSIVYMPLIQYRDLAHWKAKIFLMYLYVFLCILDVLFHKNLHNSLNFPHQRYHFLQIYLLVNDNVRAIIIWFEYA